ncbi:MAG TPA: hypothetical protein VHB21_15350, partial [Minicystis sp.]|nr:hypothetical protein [Minicystis sp.]
RALVQGWAYAGLAAQPPTLAVRVRGSAELAAQAAARLTVLSLGDFGPAEAGLPDHANVSWSASASDAVELDGDVGWAPSALVASGALVGAQSDAPGASTVDEALATVLDCDTLADELGGYPGCDAGCLAGLCATALAFAWSYAPTASTGDFALSITGSAQVDDSAAPASVSGHWLGVLRDGAAQASVGGAAVAVKTGTEPPPP